jgi:hypothetical protein
MTQPWYGLRSMASSYSLTTTSSVTTNPRNEP